MDFRHITACGECCMGCAKKSDGRCGGCNETQGHCEEWAQPGVCHVYACTRAHGVSFCGVCEAFPCDHLPMRKWRPDCVQELSALAEEYRLWQARQMGMK